MAWAALCWECCIAVFVVCATGERGKRGRVCKYTCRLKHEYMHTCILAHMHHDTHRKRTFPLRHRTDIINTLRKWLGMGVGTVVPKNKKSKIVYACTREKEIGCETSLRFDFGSKDDSCISLYCTLCPKATLFIQIRAFRLMSAGILSQHFRSHTRLHACMHVGASAIALSDTDRYMHHLQTMA